MALGVFSCFTPTIYAQNKVSGTIVSERDDADFTTWKVMLDDIYIAIPSENGDFSFDAVNDGKYVLKISDEEKVVLEKDAVIFQSNLNLGILNISSSGSIDLGIPTIDLVQLENDENEEQDISGILSASRDRFINTASFTWGGTARFRIRGYDSEHTSVYFNGIAMNNVDDGRVFWNAWGGLNDVLRNRTVSVGLAQQEEGISGVGGGSNVDTRARHHRKQKKIGYAVSNRSYRNRLMATYSTGMKLNGWALSLSGSRRWAQEGFIEGTSYDGWSYFASVDRKINDNHILNLTVYGAPTSRGRSSGATQEIYDLTGTNYYNAYWGYQAGEKRNSRLTNSHIPTAMLTHDWDLNKKGASLSTTLYAHHETNGRTSIDWGDARNPNADYYQKLPSYQTGDYLPGRTRELISADPSLLQLDWQYIYDANKTGLETIENANGSGQSVTGLRARYIQREEHADSKQYAFASNLHLPITERHTVYGRVDYMINSTDNYNEVEDLLGADYFLDQDRFIDDSSQSNSDLNAPNKTVGEGDRYGYNYKMEHRIANINIQNAWTFKKFDFQLGAQFGQTSYWRNGAFRNGTHPDDSFGESERLNFTTYSGKVGATYKISGRQYMYVNGMYQSKAPYSRFAFASARIWNQVIPDLENEEILGGEIGYLYRSAGFKAKAVGYLTDFKNGYDIAFFFDDSATANSRTTGAAFANEIDRNIDRRHLGLEMALEFKVLPTLDISASAAIGEYKFTSRSETFFVNDDLVDLPNTTLTSYTKNFFVPGTPQKAYALGLHYNSPKFWYLNITGSLYDDIYLDFSRLTRTQEFFDGVAINELDPLLPFLRDQKKLDSFYSLDLFGGKSFKFGQKFVYLTVGVNNVLDSQTNATGGFEQSRFRVNQETGQPIFTPRIFYGYGRNYFVQLSLRI